MRFSKIKINGFKGFADPVEFPIRDGLSGIVGPNGCGKSNLVEAVGWVMGENRPTIVRSDSMEDVIFNGSATRPACGFAEVVLEIQDRNGAGASISVDGDDLEISRKIERRSGSVFRANGKEVRHRDVQLLFADSASGARSAALVRQGQVSELINAKPSNRSGIIEDAAGISGLHRRRHDAELKLDATEQNLLRVEDTIQQLQNQKTSLQRQARHARQYKSIAQQLRAAEMKMLFLKWRTASQQQVESERKLQQCSLAAASHQAEASKAGRKKFSLQSNLDPLRSEVNEASAATQRIRAEYERTEEQIISVNRVLTSLTAQLGQIEQDLSREIGLQADAVKTIDELEKQRTALEEKAAGFFEIIGAAKNDATRASETLKLCEVDYEQKSLETANLVSSRNQAANSRESARRKLVSCQARESSIAAELKLVRSRIRSLAKTLDRNRMAKSEARRSVQNAESHFQETESRRSALQAQFTDASAKTSTAESRLGALQSEAVELSRFLGSENGNGHKAYDQVRVKPGYETAIGAAMGDDLFVDRIDEDGKMGWVELPPLVPGHELPKGATRLNGLVEAPDFMARRLEQVGLVEERDAAAIQANLLPGQRIVTTGGDLYRWDGMRVSGEFAQNAAAMRLSQVNRLAELQESVATSEAELRITMKSKKLAETAFEEMARTNQIARDSWRQAEKAFSIAVRRFSDAEAEESIAVKNRGSLEAELARAKTETANTAKELRDAERALIDLTNLDAAKQSSKDARKKLDEARSRKLELQSYCSDLTHKERERTRRLADNKIDLETWQTRGTSANRRISELGERKFNYQTEYEQTIAVPEQLSKRKITLAEQIEASEVRKRSVAEELAVAEATFRQAENGEKEAQRKLREAGEARARAEVLSENAGAQLETITGRVREQYGVSPGQLADQINLDELDFACVDAAEAEVERLRRKRESLGAVNLRAEHDISELLKELETITTEKYELEAAVLKIRKCITKLNREGKRKLLDAFETVNEHFAELFSKLFGGGSARLELIEGNDPLKIGLEIFCHPPGKRATTLSLLSGGEQSLTSLALIFAFFLANPSPVCVLDEVDSPLDDTNVMRMCDLLNEVARKTNTRFLIVTHNAITMSRMDRLYGITMQEKGVSQLVSVDLGEAERLAA